MKKKKETLDNTYLELGRVFKKIENMKEFKRWFGKPCKEFAPLCFNCKLWTKWNLFKEELFEELT